MSEQGTSVDIARAESTRLGCSGKEVGGELMRNEKVPGERCSLAALCIMILQQFASPRRTDTEAATERPCLSAQHEGKAKQMNFRAPTPYLSQEMGAPDELQGGER
jgi:hypothetical protein